MLSEEQVSVIINALIDNDINTIVNFIYADPTWLTFPLYGKDSATLLASFSAKTLEAVHEELTLIDPNNSLSIMKQSLITAVKKGDLETIKAFAEQNKAWFSLPITEHPYTILHLAILRPNADVIRLIANKDNVNQIGKNAYTPLKYALFKNIELIKPLLEKGADVNDVSEYDTPLCEAIIQENTELVKLLLEWNADVNLATKYKSTPLGKAISKKNTELVKLLLEYGADVNQTLGYKETALSRAIKQGDGELVQLLLDKGAEVNKKSGIPAQSPLSQADAMGRDDLVAILLENGADLKQEWSGKYALAQELVDAVKQSDIETIKKFAKQNIEWFSIPLFTDASTLMHLVTLIGDIMVLNALLEYGVDVNIADLKKRTPLYHAAILGHNDVTKKLLSVGAKVNACDEEGNTPLHLASYNNHAEVVKTLLTNGADVNQKNKLSQTALTIAAVRGHTKVVEALLFVPTDDKNKEDALYYAALKGHLTTFNTLLHNGTKFGSGYFGRLMPLTEILSSLPECAVFSLENDRIVHQLRNTSILDTARFMSTLQPEILGDYDKKLYKNASRWDECFNSNKYDGFFQRLGAYLFDDYKAKRDKKYYNKVIKKMGDLPDSDAVNLSRGHIYAYGLLGKTQNLEMACECYIRVSDQKPKNRIYSLYELANIYLLSPDTHQKYMETHRELGLRIATFLEQHPEDGHILAINALYLSLESPETTFMQDNETRLANANLEYPSDEVLERQWNKEHAIPEALSSNPNGFFDALKPKLAMDEDLDLKPESAPKIGA